MDSEEKKLTTELKPCPFCGSRNVAQGASRDMISVWCFCGAQGPSVPFPEINPESIVAIHKCYAAWNRRELDKESFDAGWEKAKLLLTPEDLSRRSASRAGLPIDAEAIVDALFEDLRDRHFLKWLFSEQPTLIGRLEGAELRSLDADVQQEIRDAWVNIIAASPTVIPLYASTAQAEQVTEERLDNLTPLHLEMLRRGEGGREIWVHDRAELFGAEMAALSALSRAGMVEQSNRPKPPGPPTFPSFVITEVGRAALAANQGRQ
jgi:hypothetical protein